MYIFYVIHLTDIFYKKWLAVVSKYMFVLISMCEFISYFFLLLQKKTWYCRTMVRFVISFRCYELKWLFHCLWNGKIPLSRTGCNIFLTCIFQVLLLVLNMLRILFGAPGVGPWPVILLQLPVGYPKTNIHTSIH